MTLDIKKRKFLLTCLLVYLGISFLLFGDSLRYGFVYDDHTRIEFNPGIKSLRHPARFFLDRTTQAGIPDLHRDNYRPLVTLNYAVDYALWGLRAGFYRAENILLHVFNAVMVALLAQYLLGLSVAGAFLGGLLFLIHPVQTEAVVSIAGRSNVLSTFFALLCLFFWEGFQKRPRRGFLVSTYVTFLLGLFCRENIVVLPLLLLLKSKRPIRVKHFLCFGIIVLFYVIIRMTILEQFKQAPFWGGTFWTNIANVVQIWPLYLHVAAWPHHLRATYSDLNVVTSFVNSRTLYGIAYLFIYVVAMISLWKKKPRLSYALAFFLICWLPGSNLIPLTTLFAERLLYPMLIALAFLIGLLADFILEKINQAKPLLRIPAVVLFSMPFIVLAGVTVGQTRVWETDYTLWRHATRVNPEGWFGWYSLGLVALDQSTAANAAGDRTSFQQWSIQADQCFRVALLKIPPAESVQKIKSYLERIKTSFPNTEG
jgi:protein O-mannosyl-transferase